MPQTLPQLVQFYGSSVFYTLVLHSVLVATVFQFVYKMNQKLGRGVLLKFILGSYYNPKEELRVFMFMDLKSSTYYAEKLGHFKYSRLIQDCFNHLTECVLNNNANIYQYVGDEVVLTWKIDKKYDAMQSIKFFYDFNDILESKKECYLNRYGMMPVFKAGLHAGKVMVAQVGQLKSEIAYHGDAINTASRVQNLCNTYQSRLLITSDFLNYFKHSKKPNTYITIKSIGKIKLDGKESMLELYSLPSIRF
jgi:adenylate cyclase